MAADKPRLFHVSEEPDIARFEPRPVGAWDSRVSGLAVWAIDDEHLANYLFPRDCPRVAYACDAQTAAGDKARFFGASRARRIIAIEFHWLERALSTPLTIYEMPADSFELLDAHAGHFVSRRIVVPLGKVLLADPIGALSERDVELRVVKDIQGLHDEVVHSTLSFSSTRLRNART